MDMLRGLLKRFTLLIFLICIDAFLNEYALQRGEMKQLVDLPATDLKLAAEHFAGGVGAVAQHVAHADKLRLAILNHATIRINRYLAVSKRIKSVNGLV